MEEKVDPRLVPENLKEVPESGPYYQFGGFWRRFAAFIIDSFVSTFLMIPFVAAGIWWITKTVAGGSMEENIQFIFGPAFFLLFIISMLVPFVYQWILLVKFNTTIGKKALGLKVVKKDGSKITFGTVLLRQLVGPFISSAVFYLGYLWIGYDIKKRSWSDMIAGTYVVHYKEITKEAYKEQVNRDQHKDRFIVVCILFLVGQFVVPFIIIFAVMGAIFATLGTQGAIENIAKAGCVETCKADQECINKCTEDFADLEGSSMPTNDGWVTYKSPAQTYSIDFPQKPQTTTEDFNIGGGLPAIKQTTNGVDTLDGYSYAATSLTLPDAIASVEPNEIFMNIQNGMTQGNSAKLITSKEGTFQGVPALEYVIQTSDGYAKFIVFMMENNLYMLGMSSQKNSFPDYNRYTESFIYTAE